MTIPFESHYLKNNLPNTFDRIAAETSLHNLKLKIAEKKAISNSIRVSRLNSGVNNEEDPIKGNQVDRHSK